MFFRLLGRRRSRRGSSTLETLVVAIALAGGAAITLHYAIGDKGQLGELTKSAVELARYQLQKFF